MRAVEDIMAAEAAIRLSNHEIDVLETPSQEASMSARKSTHEPSRVAIDIKYLGVPAAIVMGCMIAIGWAGPNIAKPYAEADIANRKVSLEKDVALIHLVQTLADDKAEQMEQRKQTAIALKTLADAAKLLHEDYNKRVPIPVKEE
jgi:hypothetical protein